MAKARLQPVLISIVLLLAAAVSSFLSMQLAQNLNQLEQHWQNHARVQLKKEETYRQLTDSFGFGGFIHHFKNFVIRRDTHYLSAAGESIADTYAQIERYRSFDLNKAEHHALDAITATLDEYNHKFNWMISVQPYEMPVTELDDRVKVDDSAAFEGLNTLSQIQGQATRNTLSKTDLIVADSRGYVTTILSSVMIMLALLGIIIWSVFRRLSVAFARLRTVFDAVPDVLLKADSSGRITEVNDKAAQVFGYSTRELKKMTVEDLLPDILRDAHRKQRKDFIESERTAAMGDRNLDLCAQRKNGEIFPVDISLASYQDHFDKSSIVVLRDIWERKEMERQLSGDHLTRLPTRRALVSYLQDEVNRARSIDTTFSIILCDIDNFRKINEQFDYQTGDEVLISLADLLRKNVRKIDVLGRWDGEEFMVLCPHTGLRGAESLAEHLRERIENYPLHPDAHITISLAVSQYSLDSETDIAEEIRRLRQPLERKSQGQYNRVWTNA